MVLDQAFRKLSTSTRAIYEEADVFAIIGDIFHNICHVRV